ncbi:TPA: helix-turn-helix domain-containing protein [Vibrio cholerae]|nr:helix-turn-helix domain-containing protein [Vibrio cholerae]
MGCHKYVHLALGHALDVAQHLGIAKDYRWRERKGLPTHKIGRLWKFQLSEVDEWVRAGGANESSNEEQLNDSTGNQE